MTDTGSPKGVSLFDILNNVTGSKNATIVNDDYLRAHAPFQMNRFLMQRKTTILVANLLNCEVVTDKRFHHDFLLYTKPLSFYKGKWVKVEPPSYDEYIEIVQKIYGVSKARAHEYCKMLTTEQLIELKSMTDTGGAKSAPKKRSGKK